MALRRDLYNEDNWNNLKNNPTDVVYDGPYDFLWREKDKANENNNHVYLQSQMYNVDDLGEYDAQARRHLWVLLWTGGPA